MDTRFSYEGKTYRVDANVCNFDTNIILLPDDRYLRITEAYESLPPQIAGVEETS